MSLPAMLPLSVSFSGSGLSFPPVTVSIFVVGRGTRTRFSCTTLNYRRFRYSLDRRLAGPLFPAVSPIVMFSPLSVSRTRPVSFTLTVLAIISVPVFAFPTAVSVTAATAPAHGAMVTAHFAFAGTGPTRPALAVAVGSGLHAMQRILKRGYQYLAAVVVRHFTLLDERYGGDERLNGAGILPRGCVTHCTRDGTGGHGAVATHHLFHFRLTQSRHRSAWLRRQRVALRRPSVRLSCSRRRSLCLRRNVSWMTVGRSAGTRWSGLMLRRLLRWWLLIKEGWVDVRRRPTGRDCRHYVMYHLVNLRILRRHAWMRHRRPRRW